MPSIYSVVAPAPAKVSDPDDVTGDPLTVNADGATKPTLVTVPVVDVCKAPLPSIY